MFKPGSSDMDRSLLDAMKRGDVSAFTRLYDIYAPTVYALCLHFCENQTHADELLESVFRKLWQIRSLLRCPPGGILPCIRGFLIQGVSAPTNHAEWPVFQQVTTNGR